VKNPLDSVDGSEIQRENPPVIFHEIPSKMVYSPYQLVCRISSINGIALKGVVCWWLKRS